MPGRQDRTTSHIQDMARRSNAAGMDTAAAEYRKLFLRRPFVPGIMFEVSSIRPAGGRSDDVRVTSDTDGH